MTKKSIILLACLFFTIAPFQVSAMLTETQQQTLAQAFTVLIPENYTPITTKNEQIEAIATYSQLTNNEKNALLQARQQTIFETLQALKSLVQVFQEIKKENEDFIKQIAQPGQTLNAASTFLNPKMPDSDFIFTIIIIINASMEIREKLTIQHEKKLEEQKNQKDMENGLL